MRLAIKAALLNRKSGNDVDSGLRLEAETPDANRIAEARARENFQTVPINREAAKKTPKRQYILPMDY